MDPVSSELSGFIDRLARVRQAIAQASAKRPSGPAVQLIGVSKLQSVAALRLARQAGLDDFGENYAQELQDKQRVLDDDPEFVAGAPLVGRPPPRWHFIGKLQRNKVKRVVGCTLIHAVDRPELVAAIDQRARELGIIQECLCAINWGEAQKAGVLPAEVRPVLDAFARADNVRCTGLMTIPPVSEPAAAASYFAALAELRAVLATEDRPHVGLRELSMGMSSDFVEAIAHGATMVRIGTAIFGARPQVDP